MAPGLSVYSALPATPFPNMLIDTHHHFVPEFYAQAVANAGGDPSGWHVPEWNISTSLSNLARNNATTAILSLTSPGAPIAGNDTGARALARKANEFCASIRDERPSQFGFFAALPSLLDTEGTLAEIAYALDVLKADGVTVFSRYGDGNYYLGNASYDPIWTELNLRKAVVFVHPTHPVDTNRVNPQLLQPIIDYPHETTRTAMDMLTSGIRRRFPDCKVILSHAGGSLPWIIPRALMARKGLNASQIPDGITYDQAMAEFRSFYFDLALSSSHPGLDLLLKLVPREHITYGSDVPYAPAAAVTDFRAQLESYPLDPETREMIYYKNALELIPRLKQYAP